ncbi:YceI family protein [Alkalisalibacterium limincola]|uniref:YceI family protein n=1 Tax=Alkalisalibacterium limincola TaxID=2699169 RepID=A0A5C8KNP1_9GAMM|nr:YceI family protein [Alkalisalibacterium limincola]TXK61074.1 YceI family protein [Alkalisalibacterium limincola]
MKHVALASALALAASALAPAHAAEKWEFDKAHTQVLFVVNHLGFTDLTGQFRVVDGELMLDRENLANSSVTATLKAESVDMNHDGIDRHLKNEDFFYVEQYPELTFRSTSVTVVDEGTLKMDGELEMIGQTLPVSLDVTINNIGAHPMSGKPHAGFTATGSLKRTDWGMDYAAPAVGDEVSIRINLEARPASD